MARADLDWRGPWGEARTGRTYEILDGPARRGRPTAAVRVDGALEGVFADAATARRFAEDLEAARCFADGAELDAADLLAARRALQLLIERDRKRAAAGCQAAAARLAAASADRRAVETALLRINLHAAPARAC